MSVGSGTFLPFPLDLDGFPLLPLPPPLVEPLPLDFAFPFLDPFPYWIYLTLAVSCILSICVCVETSNQAISMNLGKVTSLPSLMIFVWILSEAKPLIIVSLSTMFHVFPSRYSASLTNLRAFMWQPSRLMEPWNSLLSSTNAIKAFDLGAMCSSKSSNTFLSDSCFHHGSFPHFPIYQWAPSQFHQNNK